MQYSDIKLPTKIKKIVDGDTVVADIDHLLNIYTVNARLRLAGIDTQSLKTTTGKASKQALINKLEGKDVYVSFFKVKSRA
jgi:endonuclease YncB( thermonuclease family)